jgi:hypothetical protein
MILNVSEFRDNVQDYISSPVLWSTLLVTNQHLEQHNKQSIEDFRRKIYQTSSVEQEESTKNQTTTIVTMISSRRLTLLICLFVILSAFVAENGDIVAASGKKKFLKGFILGALLSKNHYPV